MKFKVERVSQHRLTASQNNPPDASPCEGAYLGTIRVWDSRTYSTSVAFKQAQGRDWYAEGTDHTTDSRGIKRCMGESPAWYVDIPTLEELVAFRAKVGADIMLEDAMEDGETLTIRIVDGYL